MLLRRGRSPLPRPFTPREMTSAPSRRSGCSPPISRPFSASATFSRSCFATSLAHPLRAATNHLREINVSRGSCDQYPLDSDCSSAYNALVQTLTPSLRDRQRLKVLKDIHDATASLLLECGWTATTIDMIATKAGVSTRTFFNHYPTKEDAALGLRPLYLPDDAVFAFTSSTEDLLERTVILTLAILRSAVPNDGQGERRAHLLNTLPELRVRMRNFSASAGELIEPVLIKELTKAATARDGSAQADLQDCALALRMLAGTVIRYAFAKDPTSLSADNPAQLIAAVSTFREVARPHND